MRRHGGPPPRGRRSHGGTARGGHGRFVVGVRAGRAPTRAGPRSPSPPAPGAQCGLVEDGARHPGDVPALVLEPGSKPGLERNARPSSSSWPSPGERRPPSRSPARARRGRRTSRLQSQLERVSAKLRVVVQPATESGKRPPERSQRVVRLGEEEACEALARRREPRAQEVGEQAPRLVAPWGLHGSAIPFDSGRAQKVDAQAHRPFFLVTRVVTRLTVTLSVVEFKPSERKERTCA